MCGRTCCTLGKDLVPLACTTVLPNAPKWKDAPSGNNYRPSTNVPPTAHTPVLYRENSSKKEEEEDESSVVVQPMLWGMVPFWHDEENPTSHGLTTNNARLEGLGKSKLYQKAVLQNQRCVVICDGFYEWKALDKKSKQPYLVYAHQDSEELANQLGSLSDLKVDDVWSKRKGWFGPKPLFMAGLYSVWHNKAKNHSVYSYSVITRDSNSALDWLHERMPAILPDESAVQQWLDPSLKGMDALEVLEPISKGQISWHAVSSEVGNVRNQGGHLAKAVKLDKSGKAEAREASAMAKWLVKKRKHDSESDDDQKSTPKKSN